MRFGAIREPLDWEGWPEARRLLERSTQASGDVAIEEVESELSAGKAVLWVGERDGIELAVVTQIVPVNEGLQCFLWQLAGEHLKDDWLRFLPMIEEWGRAHGCTSIEGNMRPGFERILSDWTKVAIVLRKSL